MTKQDFFYDSTDGNTIVHAVLWTPDTPVRAIVQIIHGMAEYTARYAHFAQKLCEAGIAVVGEDHLGHGQSVENKDGSKHPYGYFCAENPDSVTIDNVHKLRCIMQEQYPEVPYFYFGHSMGSFILRNVLCRHGEGLAGAIICGTGMQPRMVVSFARALASLQNRGSKALLPAKMLDRMAFGSYNKKILQPETAMDWLSTDTAQVDKYIADPLCGFTFTANGFYTLFSLIERLYDEDSLQQMDQHLPVLFTAGDCDPVGDYGKAVEQVAQQFTKLGMESVETRLWPGMRHEILNEKGREKVEQDLQDWILGLLP